MIERKPSSLNQMTKVCLLTLQITPEPSVAKFFWGRCVYHEKKYLLKLGHLQTKVGLTGTLGLGNPIRALHSGPKIRSEPSVVDKTLLLLSTYRDT